MIRRVTVRHFKRFEEEVFDLAESVVLAGPNNSGKSTLLQAIYTWKFALDRWVEHAAENRNDLRTGAPVQRSEFLPVPLREMNLLWERRLVASEPTGEPRPIEILVEADGAGGAWTCGVEIHYANTEMIYVRPSGAADLDGDALIAFPPQAARDLEVTHLPALFGIARDEPRHERGMQDLLASSGRPGDILRNLLFEVSREEDQWRRLTERVHDLFGIELHPPKFHSARPYLLCEYSELGRETKRLDLAGAGSGALQAILLFAFLHARRGAVLLLDEPDAHQHVMLQRQVYQGVREVASRRDGQVVAATHSEVILNTTEPSEILGFFGSGPRTLATSRDRTRLVEALRELEVSDLLRARERGAILYVEDESDEDILREWARILEHPAREFFALPNIRRLRGRLPKRARRHFSLLRTEFPELPGVCLLDRNDHDARDEGGDQAGLQILQWKRYEIENYLLHPDAIRRFVARTPTANPDEIDAEFRRQLPGDADPFSDLPALVEVKASDSLLLPMLERAGRRTKKTDLYQLASVMKREEIHPEVREKLDRIAEELLPRASG